MHCIFIAVLTGFLELEDILEEPLSQGEVLGVTTFRISYSKLLAAFII